MHALVGLGSNLGDRPLALVRARRLVLLAARFGSQGQFSAVFESEAVGAPQPNFLNAVVALETDLDPSGLFEWLMRVEATLGRLRSAPCEPRCIDVDLLAVDRLVISTRTLTLPHPEMANRRFVLQPLCEVAPDWVHPTLDKTATALLEELPKNPWVRRLGDVWWGE